MPARIKGMIAAPFTPMDSDGGVHLDSIARQALFLHRNGVAGAFVCGTTGEGPSLTVFERIDVASRWVEVKPGDFLVVVHVGHSSLESSKRLAAHAEEIGAWAIASLGPVFFKPRTVEELAAYCAEVAAAAPTRPFYYYHIPSLTGIDFRMIDFLEAARDRIPTLAGIKFTHENMMDYALCRAFDGGRFDVLFGRDEMLLCALALGGRSAVGSTYNLAAPLYRQLIEAFDAGDLDGARDLQRKSIDMIRFLMETTGSFLPAAKAVMKILGVDCGPVRSPLPALTVEQFEIVRGGLEKIGFFEYCSK
jgi:N-acetylneuraminate lyase